MPTIEPRTLMEEQGELIAMTYYNMIKLLLASKINSDKIMESLDLYNERIKKLILLMNKDNIDEAQEILLSVQSCNEDLQNIIFLNKFKNKKNN